MVQDAIRFPEIRRRVPVKRKEMFFRVHVGNIGTL